MPLSAVFAAGSPNTITIAFDVELATDLLDTSRWSARWANMSQNILSATAAGFNVVLEVSDNIADPGADVVSYNDSAADVRSRFGGLPTVSFTDFAVT